MKKKLFSILLSLAMVITMMPAMTMTAFAEASEIDIATVGAFKEDDDTFCVTFDYKDSPLQARYYVKGDSLEPGKTYILSDMRTDTGIFRRDGDYYYNSESATAATFTLNLDDKGNATYVDAEMTTETGTYHYTFQVKYYAANFWDCGDWTWKEMTKTENNIYTLNGVIFGGTGVNINIKDDDPDAKFFFTNEILYEHKNGEAYTETPTVPEGTEVSFRLYAPSIDQSGWTLTMIYDVEVEETNWSKLAKAMAGDGTYSTEQTITDEAETPTNLFTVKDETTGDDTTRTITLLSDITATSGDSALVVSADAKIVLDLNGHTIDRNLNEATANGFVVNVEGNLTIKDIATGGGKITGGNNKCVHSKPYGGGVSVASGGALTMTGGEITGNFSVKADGDDGDGGGVYVNKNGSFNMSGGKITDNMAETKGGGVYIVNNATFKMTGGEISGNSSTKGAGGVHSQGNCIMSGNSIISHNSGTGVNAYNGTFTMSGNSIISYNNATGTGAGGLLVGQGCEFTMSENSKISYNSSTGSIGGAYVNIGTFKMTGGSIDHNTGSFAGGVLANGNVTIGGTAKITDNLKAGTTNNVCLNNGKYITVGDGTDAPASGMSVGVTTQTPPEEVSPVQLTTNGTANHLQYFFSDNADCYVGFNSSSNHLELKKPVAGNHIITVIPSEHGSVNPSPYEASAGTTVTLTVTPASNYELSAGSLKVISGDGTEITVTKSGNTYTFTMPDSNVTVSASFIKTETPPGPTPGPDPEPTPAEEEYKAPVEGENTVNVNTTITDGKAKVEEISQSTLEEAVNPKSGTETTDTIVIDLSQAKQDVTAVELTKKTVENLADVVASDKNAVETVTIQMKEATVEMDAKTLETISEEANGNSIVLVVDKTKEENLKPSQKETLLKFDVNKTFEAYFESNGQRITSFNGGKVVVGIKFKPEQGKKVENYKIYYIDDNGKAQKFASKYVDGMLKFTTTHFSDYAIVYEGTSDVLLLQAKTSGKKAIKLSWNAQDNATKYVVYGAKCGYNYKKLKTTTGKSYTVKKASGKKLKAHKTYKFYVVAYDAVGNKISSRSIHYIYKNTQGKYANVKSIKAKYDNLLLSVGVTQKIGAKYKMYSGKKHLKKAHGQALKFFSNNTDVVTVSKTGVVKAVGKGKATIYIQDIGGKYCKTKVTVE